VPNASNVAEVEAIKGRLDGSVAALLTEYRGLKVAELGELRASLRGSSTEYRVLKNTLTSIAVREAGYEDLVALLQGPTAVAFVHGDPVQAAKDLAEFARTHPALIVKGGVMDGRVLGAAEVRQLATLESREVLLARLAGLLQASAQQTVNLLAAPLRQVATMTAALRDKTPGEPQGGDAAAPPSDQKAEEPGASAAEATESPVADATAAEATAAEATAAEANDTPAAEAQGTDTNDTNDAPAAAAGAES
jgi:large subunit ribosomal protein L10